ncbi:hypothetical protein BAUCODRAFT_120406 [Baudoinia panamericana UAMH 10762]|uniref:Uncharacterized protein n=1 Tax=Baudoinia panamericana (strain UAMH 10762) TaxID=717646 RepID=M2NIC1_BAUPA|nr:uncharacterized protein BAUCODRAFT_120406 [Baudoinia panamericana UAMH 10762]EMC99119.1 hypothetical protein BAUCODRAFT_120406 [Baudoinia panamericana UAMH 10762]
MWTEPLTDLRTRVHSNRRLDPGPSTAECIACEVRAQVVHDGPYVRTTAMSSAQSMTLPHLCAVYGQEGMSRVRPFGTDQARLAVLQSYCMSLQLPSRPFGTLYVLHRTFDLD